MLSVRMLNASVEFEGSFSAEFASMFLIWYCLGRGYLSCFVNWQMMNCGFGA